MDLVRGIAFSGFRSFSSETHVRLAPLGKINLVAGQNNSGKSNVLRVVGSLFAPPGAAGEPGPLDRPLGDATHSFRRFVAYTEDELIEIARQTNRFNNRSADALRDFLRAAPFRPFDDDLVWLGLQPRKETAWQYDDQFIQEVAEAHSNSAEAATLAQVFTSASTSSPGGNAKTVLANLRGLLPARPGSQLVAGVRAISDDNEMEVDLNGTSIKKRLQELQSPDTERLEDRLVFARIQEFVRAVMEDDTVTIDIPHNLSTIHITQHGHTLPIENIGTGIHEVVILAAAATVVTDEILCIEEPEVHLHPLLQRKLLRYLSDNTSNQYFISTHSAHMLDSELASIFHVTRVAGRSTISYAGSAAERASICHDLGYRPSDLVQTNAVIWVEGPSDRLYLRWWIERAAPGLFVEGIHYSIMFYGGALLKGLSALDSEEVDEFISLRKLNRHMAVLIDSDKTSRGKKLNASKTRVVEELSANSETGLAWVTAGYTIENYVPAHVLASAVVAAHPSAAGRVLEDFGRYDNPLTPDRVGVSPSKVAIAKRVVESDSQSWPLDLRKQVDGVLALIARANGTDFGDRSPADT